MKNSIIYTLALLLLALSASSQNSTKEYSGFENPESIAAYKQYLYVSNMGPKMEPTAKDGDGYISQLLRKDGKLVELKYYTGLNSPKGIYIKCHTMYVADVDKVVAIDLKTRKKLWDADFSKLGINYLNDITCGGLGSLFVSATDKNAVYRICKKGTKIKLFPVKGNIEGANGLYRACNKLFIANYGRGGQTDGSFGVVHLCSKKYKAFKLDGIYDGIQRSCGKLIVSDWISNNESKGKGRLVIYKPCKKQMITINAVSLNGPSDIYKDCHTKTLWIPVMRDGKLISIPLKEIANQARGKNN